MSQKLNAIGTQVSIRDEGGRGGLSIALSQPKGSDARWKFSVRGDTKEGIFPLGEFITSPPGKQLTRIVAIANCPGVNYWDLLVSLIDGDFDDSEVSLAIGDMTGESGLVRVAERYKQYSGAAAGAVSILPGETVLGWTASAGAAGGTVTINSFGAITIPVSGSMTGGGGGLIEGPVTFTFGGNITSYLIEVAESA